jgi:hypothetical protein
MVIYHSFLYVYQRVRQIHQPQPAPILGIDTGRWFQLQIPSLAGCEWHANDRPSSGVGRLRLRLSFLGHSVVMFLVALSLDWFKGKSTGNHGFYHQISGFPVNFPIIQFYDLRSKVENRRESPGARWRCVKTGQNDTIFGRMNIHNYHKLVPHNLLSWFITNKTRFPGDYIYTILRLLNQLT